VARDASVRLAFGGAERVFRLGIGELVELEESLGIGPLALMRRVLSGDWKTAEIREPIRIGLIGGGMTAKEAYVLARRYVDELADWGSNMAIAGLVLEAAIFGPEDEPVGKDQPAAMTETTDSTSPACMETAP